MTKENISFMIHIMEKELENRRLFTSSQGKFKGSVKSGMISTL